MTEETSIQHIESVTHISQQTIQTAIGTITIDQQNAITFPNGIAGFPKANKLYLTNLPTNYTAEYKDLKILQSLENKELSFLVYPLSLENDIYDTEDLNLVCEMLDINPSNASLLLIISSHYSSKKESLVLTANSRAPIVINTENGSAYQYIFTHVKYPIQYEI